MLMAGYLCHPCLPNMCGLEACENLPGTGYTCAGAAAPEDCADAGVVCGSACHGACFGACFEDSAADEACVEACEQSCEGFCSGDPPTPAPTVEACEEPSCPATPVCTKAKHKKKCPCTCPSCEEGPNCPASPDCTKAKHVKKCPCACGADLPDEDVVIIEGNARRLDDLLIDDRVCRVRRKHRSSGRHQFLPHWYFVYSFFTAFRFRSIELINM